MGTLMMLFEELDSIKKYLSFGLVVGQTCGLIQKLRIPHLKLDTFSSQDVEVNICKFANKGTTPSQIGVILRDSHGRVTQVKSVTGSEILRVLKLHGLAAEIPEDLYHLIKKAFAIAKHVVRNRKDEGSMFGLILVESRICRFVRYYKKTKKLPPVWKYESIAIRIRKLKNKRFEMETWRYIFHTFLEDFS